MATYLIRDTWPDGKGSRLAVGGGINRLKSSFRVPPGFCGKDVVEIIFRRCIPCWVQVNITKVDFT